MDGHAYDGIFDGLVGTLFLFGAIAGVIIALIIGGLVWGGCKLHEKYSVKIEKKVIPASTNVVTVTNYISVTK
jgi:hypothetical protein